MTLEQASTTRLPEPGDDPYLWLEDLDGERVSAWVTHRNQATLIELSGERFDHLLTEARDAVDSDDKIPGVSRRGEHLYNFWRGAGHSRGVWRRTTLEEYRTDAPAWDVLLDLDELADAEGENWVWQGADVIAPEYSRAMISLSPGGSDATVEREFDLTTCQFVQGGFALPAAKSSLAWEDHDTLLVGTDFGEGSLSEAGYPRVIKRWRRGTALSDAEPVFTGEDGDIGVFVQVNRASDPPRTIFVRYVDNNHRETLVLHDGQPVRLEVPTDAPMAENAGRLLITLVTPWECDGVTYQPGSVLVTDLDDLIAGRAHLRVVFEPDERTFMQMAAWTKNRLLLLSVRDVASRIEILTPGDWTPTPLAGLPVNTDVGINSIDQHSDEIFLLAKDFTTPTTLLHGTADGEVHPIKTTPAQFDADAFVVEQHFVTSEDGTRVPYFQISPRDAAGPRPTLMQGYGAFAVSQRPFYLASSGPMWLARGGSIVVANIRGGGEYGPQWYLQSVREGRHRVAEDFAAVARDLAARGVTTARQLGAIGSSAGGLLMGVMLTKYPELFGALVCRQPMLDMHRFPDMGAAMFVSEFGDPRKPDEWAYIKDYSPYHNIVRDRRYPSILITTSTNDDRVRPGHARKMAAALEAAGHEVLFYESADGGHGSATTTAHAALLGALTYEFLHRTLNADAASA